MQREVILGIDLGTTNSCVSIIERGKPVILVNQEGRRTTPSVVGFSKGEVLVGDVARRQAITNPSNTIFSIKRFIGQSYEDVLQEIDQVPYSIVKSSENLVTVSIGDKNYTPQELSAQILLKLKEAAEQYLGTSVSKAVITVPAYFKDSQRQATKDAGRIAGLEVLRIINEPTAAALAYGVDKKHEAKVVVFDCGGGTHDVSILEIGDGVVEVLATNGDTHLGGDNFDEAIIKHILTQFQTQSGIDVSNDPMAMQRIREAAEKAKIELSSALETEINLPFLTANQSGPQHFAYRLTRSKFEELISTLVERTLIPCSKALEDADLTVEQIDEVLLVGGTTRIPMVLREVEKFFKKSPSRGVNPDEVVALGAAVQAGVLSGEVDDLLLLDVTPLSLGLETLGGVMTTLIERNTTIPVRKTQVFSTASDNQTAVTVRVLQGERSMAADNMELATFTLSNIPPAKRGVPQIEIEFNLDADGILNVSAKDLGTGVEQKIVVSNHGKLEESEIERMIQQAVEHKEKDKEKKQMIEKRNQLENLIFQVQQFLSENKEQLLEEDYSNLTTALESSEEALHSEECTILSQQLNTLQNNFEEVVAKMTTSQQEESSASGE